MAEPHTRGIEAIGRNRWSMLENINEDGSKKYIYIVLGWILATYRLRNVPEIKRERIPRDHEIGLNMQIDPKEDIELG